jgi:hypothetical protein
MSSFSYERLFRVFAVAFLGAALFHGAAFVKPDLAEPVPAAWHATFVVVNLTLAYCVVRWRTRAFAVGFVAYMVQQYVEHVPRLLDIWREEQRIDWASVSSLAFVPIVLVFLVLDLRARSRSATPGQPTSASS